MTRRRGWTTRSLSTLHVHHHDGSNAMTSRCTKSFDALRVDQIGKVFDVTLIMVQINSTLMLMMVLLLKLSLLLLPFMVYMVLKLI
jgi:acetolactate synthase regulatory subunit